MMMGLIFYAEKLLVGHILMLIFLLLCICYFVMMVKFWLLWNCEGLRSHWFEL